MEYRTINPSTGEQLRTFETLSDAELDQRLERAHGAYATDWRRRPVQERAAILRAAAAELRDNSDEYAQLITLEMGKLIGTSEAEVGLSAAILDYYADRAEKFLAPRELPESPGAVVVTEPIGVIFGIEPWNFPYYQLARVAGPQLAAGNVVVIKHAENVPQCALAFARALEKAGAPEGAYTNIFATHEQAARVIADPRVAAVTVTGSERAGAAVAEQAGRSLKKVVMELGGSDPLIILEDAELDNAVQSAVFGRMFNTGQSCVGSKRIIVVGQDRGAAALDAFTEAMAALAAGDPMDPATTLGPVSSERALHTLLEQVQVAEKDGAVITVGGRRLDRPGFYLEPTVLTGIEPTNGAYHTEFFGPVTSFYVVDTEDDAIRLANDTPFGLGASVFTADTARGRRVAGQLDSGMVFVNQPAWTAPELPFGGVKRSGFGRELAELGFGEFVNRKAINVAAPGSGPWGPSPEVSQP
jgi:succinate-semialdehyde dehydrogenase / glutarate-semialdehyde dehydrogenase